MISRLSAVANLTRGFGAMTISMGGLLLRAPAQPDRGAIYEDHF